MNVISIMFGCGYPICPYNRSTLIGIAADRYATRASSVRYAHRGSAAPPATTGYRGELCAFAAATATTCGSGEHTARDLASTRVFRVLQRYAGVTRGHHQARCVQCLRLSREYALLQRPRLYHIPGRCAIENTTLHAAPALPLACGARHLRALLRLFCWRALALPTASVPLNIAHRAASCQRRNAHRACARRWPFIYRCCRAGLRCTFQRRVRAARVLLKHCAFFLLSRRRYTDTRLMAARRIE